MTYITDAIWLQYLPGPMPPQCTYEQFSAARSSVWVEDDKESTLRLIMALDELRKGCKNSDSDVAKWATLEMYRVMEEL